MSFQSITNSSPSSIVTEDRISKAVDSLLKWVNSKTTPQNPQLLEHDELLYLVLTLKKIPPTSKTNPFKIPLPHPYFSLDGTQELCLIIDDRSNRIDSKTAKQKIEVEKIPITKVLRFSKLKSDFRPFESKRQLCGSYDIFFADRRIIPLLPRLLGKTFFKTKKIPIPVDLAHKNWKEQIKNACGSCLLYLRTGTCSVVKVGKVSQPREEIAKNVAAAIEGIAEIIPKKWDNVRSLHLKLLNSVALPLYQSIPETGLLKIEVPKNLGMVESGNRIELGDEEKEKKSPGGKEVKKGKIQQFRYMDHNLDDMSADLLSDDDDDDVDDGNRIEEMSVVEKVGKKRKKMPAKSNQVLDSKMDELDLEQLELEKSSKEKKGERVKKNKKNKATNGEILVSSPSVYLDVGKKKKKKEKKASSGETLVSSFVASLDVVEKRKEATKGETLVSSSLTSLDVGKKKRKKEATSGETLPSSFGASLDVGKKRKEATKGETLVSSFLTALDVGKKKKKATKSETLVSSYLTPLDGGKKKKKKETNNEMLVGSSSPSFDVGKKKKKQESKNDELADKGTEVKNKESKKRHKIR